MEFYIKDQWIKAVAGDQLSVPKGVTHCFRNPTDQIVTVFNTHQPALRMKHYFEEVCTVLDKLTTTQAQAFRMNLITKLYRSILMNHYRHELIAQSPPDIASRLLGRISKLLGIRY